MKKRMLKILCVVSAALLLLLSIASCGKKEPEKAENAQKTQEVTEITESEADIKKPDAAPAEDKKPDVKKDEDAKEDVDEKTIKISYPFEERFVYGNKNLFYLEDDGTLTCHFKSKDDQTIEYGTGGDGRFFFITSDPGGTQSLYFLDENLELSYTPIEYPQNMYVNNISYYDGKVYYSGYDRDAEKDVICFYDPEGDAFSDDPEINKLLRFFENYKGRGLEKVAAYFDIVRDLEKTGRIFMKEPDSEKIITFDKDANELNSFELTAPTGVYQTRYYGPGYLVSEVDQSADNDDKKKEKPDGQEYILYDYETGAGYSFKIGKGEEPQGIVDVKNGYVYYYEAENKDGLETGRDYRRISINDIKAGNIKPEDITFVKEYPCVYSSYGSFTEGNGLYDAFTVKEDRVYFLSYDGDGADGRRGDVVWRSLPLEAPSEKNIQITGATERHEGFSDYGYVKEELDNRTDKDEDDFLYFSGNYQDFRFYDDIENADKMNAELERADKEFRRTGDDIANSAHKEIIENGEEGSDVSWYREYIGMGYSYSKTFSGVQKIRDNYVQVSFDDYSYFGGAHGSGASYHYLFDLRTGERKTLEGMYKGSEEEFRDIALKYSLDSWKADGEYYYYEFDGDKKKEAEMKESFLNCISLGMDMTFEDDGIYLIYPPYAVGPYASGEIKVWVPYYALDIEL